MWANVFSERISPIWTHKLILTSRHLKETCTYRWNRREPNITTGKASWSIAYCPFFIWRFLLFPNEAEKGNEAKRPKGKECMHPMARSTEVRLWWWATFDGTERPRWKSSGKGHTTMYTTSSALIQCHLNIMPLKRGFCHKLQRQFP